MNAATFSRTNFRRAALASVVALGVFGTSNGFAADATTTATATVIAPIAITKEVDLVFGSFAPGVAIGTVTVSTNGTRSATGGAILSGVGDTPSAARFDVTGTGAATYSIAWGDATTLTAGVGETMALTRISDLIGTGAGSTEVEEGTLTAGVQSIYLGGTLAVGAAQAAGTYTGSVTATVEYN